MNIDNAYLQYQSELRRSVLGALRDRNAHPIQKDLFVALVPLWTLIYTFLDEGIAVNPTKELLLSHLSSVGDIKKFVAVAADHNVERMFGSELKLATKAVAFTSYFNELVSDSLLLTNSFHLYDYRGSVIALRCMLEDLYRHLYYKDNREHFLQVHELGVSEHDLGVTPKGLREYFKRASYLKDLLKLKWQFNVGGRSATGFGSLNDTLYGRYSSFVHGSAPTTLNQFASNLDFVFSTSRSAEVLDLTKHFVLLAVSFLIFGHHEYFSRFNEHTKRVVLDAFFTLVQRQKIRELARI